MKKDNKTICSYCGQRFNSDTMKYGLCSDCYEMIIRLGYEMRMDVFDDLIRKAALAGEDKRAKAIQAAAIAYAINRIDYKKELNDFYNYLNN
jgi:hypothetical protein